MRIELVKLRMQRFEAITEKVKTRMNFFKNVRGNIEAASTLDELRPLIRSAELLLDEYMKDGENALKGIRAIRLSAKRTSAFTAALAQLDAVAAQDAGRIRAAMAYADIVRDLIAAKKKEFGI